MEGDYELAQGALARKKGCFAELWYRHWDGLFCLILGQVMDRAKAEELAQLAMIRAYRKLALFDPAKGDFRNWLLQIGANLVRMEFRRLERHPEPESLDELEETDDEPSCEGPEQVFRRRECAELLWRSVTKLPALFQSSAVLYFYEDMSKTEIAQLMGVCEGTIRYRLRRASALLRDILAEQGIESPAALR